MLTFLPAFERGEFKNAHDQYLESGFNPANVDALVDEFYDSGFVFPFNWIDWDRRRVLEAIDSADIQTLRKLLTAFIRQDRFSGGTMAAACASGSVQRVLQRLSKLAEIGELV